MLSASPELGRDSGLEVCISWMDRNYTFSHDLKEISCELNLYLLLSKIIN